MLEDMQQKRDDENREADRERRRDMLMTALHCVAWCAVALALLGYAFHTTNRTWANASFFAGIGAGNGGIVFTLLAAYRRGERRGDW